MASRWGMTIPFDGIALHEQRDWIVELADLGYTDVWSAEVDGADAFTPLALAAVWAPDLRLGTAIAPVYTRGPALLAQTTAAMAGAAPGRFVLGVGASSDVIVERWNGLPFDEPYKRVRDTVRFVRAALSGEKVSMATDSFDVKGFRLSTPPAERVPILIAALREGMLRLAGREGDGALLTWLSAEDVSTVAPIVQGADPASGPKEVVARIFVVPGVDADDVRRAGRRMIASYLNVPVYKAFHQWLGRGDALDGMWAAWEAGDRAAALEAIPDAVVDDLIIHGPAEACRERIQAYVDNGVTTPVIGLFGFRGVDLRQSIRDLAPR